MSPAGGTGADSAAARTAFVAISRSTIAAPIEWPISTGGAVSPAATCSTSAAKSSRPATNSSRARPKCRGRAATTRAPRIPSGRTKEEIGFPEPRVAVTAVNEQERRLAAVAVDARGQVRADFEIGLFGSRASLLLKSEAGSQPISPRPAVACKAGHAHRARMRARPMATRKDPPFCQNRLTARTMTPIAGAAQRLAAFLDDVRAANPGYFCRPVPPFGAATRALVIVGLAPGMHGANASGRPFTGDHAGIILYETLHAYGFASQPVATARDDGLSSSTAGSPTRSNACRPATSPYRRRSARAIVSLQPTSPRSPPAARSSRSAASRTTRRLRRCR